MQKSGNDVERFARRNNLHIFGIKENEGINATEIIQSLA